MRAILLALVLLAPGLASAREVGDGDRDAGRAADLGAFEVALLEMRQSRARASTVVTESAMGSVHRGEVARVLHHEEDAMTGLAFDLSILDPGPGAREARDTAIVAAWAFADSFARLDACAHDGSAQTCAEADAAVAEAQAQLRDATALLRGGSGFS